MSKVYRRSILFIIIGFLLNSEINAQRYLNDIDSSFFIKDTVRTVIERFKNINISGYMQPQFQVAEADGAPSFAGGNFLNIQAAGSCCAGQGLRSIIY
jgi:hypothetical protein